MQPPGREYCAPVRRLTILSAVLALASGAAACGSSEDDKKEVEKTINGLYDAFAKKDGDKVCDSLSQKQKDALTRGTRRSGGGQSCEDILGFTFAFLPSKRLQATKNAKVTDVEIDGDKATATVENQGKRGGIGLVKEDGKWLVSDFNLKQL